MTLSFGKALDCVKFNSRRKALFCFMASSEKVHHSLRVTAHECLDIMVCFANHFALTVAQRLLNQMVVDHKQTGLVFPLVIAVANALINLFLIHLTR